MTDQPKSRSEEWLTRLHIAAILGAAVWAGWTFYFKDIFIPQSAPVNISLDLALKKVGPGTSQSNSSLVAIEMRISATNPSTREVWLLPSIWTVHGIKIKHVIPLSNSDISKVVDGFKRESQVMRLGQHFAEDSRELVAFGQLFVDETLRPGEKITRVLLFYVPKDRFDEVRAEAFIPTAAHTDELVLKWVFHKEGQFVDTELYKINPDTKKPELLQPQPDKKKGGLSTYPPRYEWQYAGASADLSLWRSKQSGTDRE